MNFKQYEFCKTNVLWKNCAVWGRISHLNGDGTVSFREILNSGKLGNLYEVKISDLEKVNNKTECDRCGHEYPSHLMGTFQPWQVHNPDSRLGLYFICCNCIAKNPEPYEINPNKK
jgi:hypothetical protein